MQRGAARSLLGEEYVLVSLRRSRRASGRVESRCPIPSMRTVALISLLLGCDVGVATDAASTTAPNRARAPQSLTTTLDDPPCDYVYSGDQLIEDTCNVRRFTYDARGLLIESGNELFTY